MDLNCTDNALYLPISSCGDCAAFEQQLEAMATRIADLETQLISMITRISGIETQLSTMANRIAGIETSINSINTTVSGKQNQLTAGSGITLSGDTISIDGNIAVKWSALDEVAISIEDVTGTIETAKVLEKKE